MVESRRFGWRSGKVTAKQLKLRPTDTSEVLSPQKGDIIYDATADKLKIYTGAAWETITSA